MTHIHVVNKNGINFLKQRNLIKKLKILEIGNKIINYINSYNKIRMLFQGMGKLKNVWL